MTVRLAAVLILAALPAPATAGADPAIEADVSPAVLSHPATRSLEYRLRVTTGPEPETFHVDLQADSAFPGELELISLLTGDLGLEGPGTIFQGPLVHGDVFPCSESLLSPYHGMLPSLRAADLELPAHSTSTLVARAVTSRDAPWPGMRPRVRFRISNATFDGREGTLAADQEIVSPAPTLAGLHGVRIRLAARPKIRGCRQRPTIRLGRSLTIVGRTGRSIAGHTIRLQAVPPGRRRARRVADVRVRPDGTFVRRWRPRRVGVYEFAALYRSQREGLADDFSAPLVVSVGGRAGRSARHRRSRLSG